MKKEISKREFKKAFSKETTKQIVNGIESAIKDKHIRKSLVSVVKALDLKKIRNTSGY